MRRVLMSRPCAAMSAPFVAVGLLCASAVGAAQAAYGTATIHSFTGSDTESFLPIYAPPLIGQDGNLYGVTNPNPVTVAGATDTDTVYKMTVEGALTTLHQFDPNVDGRYANGGLLQTADGSLYGTTTSGGPAGGGTVFKLGADGHFSVLYGFGSDLTNAANGYTPNGSLVQDKDGNLYGTTYFGGAHNAGVLFKLTPELTYSVVVSFDTGDGTGAQYPTDGVIQGSDGAFYGVAGTSVYKASTNGAITKLHSFFNTAWSRRDLSPHATLVDGGNGKFYGIYGDTLFSITPSGFYTVLHRFTSNDRIWVDPKPTSLILGRDGYLYGTTLGDGLGAYGTVFRIKPNGTGFSVLYSFQSVLEQNANDGQNPVGIAMDASGNIYGATLNGGLYQRGTLFKLPPPPADWGTGWPPYISLSAFPARLNYVLAPQATSTITWSASRASACGSTGNFKGDWPVGPLPLSGSIEVPSHQDGVDFYYFGWAGGPTTYTLSCIGPTGLITTRTTSVYSVPFYPLIARPQASSSNDSGQ
jgi:uncharacterized repeat protein (TIGR03803 family)